MKSRKELCPRPCAEVCLHSLGSTQRAGVVGSAWRRHAWYFEELPGVFFKVIVPVFIPISSVSAFPLLHILSNTSYCLFKNYSHPSSPWALWLSGLSTALRTKASPVRFPVRAHAWVVGQVPSRGRARGNHTLVFLSLSVSLPSLLSKNK